MTTARLHSDAQKNAAIRRAAELMDAAPVPTDGWPMKGDGDVVAD